MRRFLLFVVMSLFAGTGAVIGSILGNAMGKTGLFVGAIIGGLIGVTAGTRMSVWRGWIAREQAPRVQVFALIAFVIAALVAGNNLWTPVIPVVSTFLVGLAAVIASRAGRLPG